MNTDSRQPLRRRRANRRWSRRRLAHGPECGILPPRLSATSLCVELQGDTIFLHAGKNTVPVGILASYSPSKGRTVFELRDANTERTISFSGVDGWDAFAFGVRVHLLLMQAEYVISNAYACRQLRKLRQPDHRLHPAAAGTIKRRRG